MEQRQGLQARKQLLSSSFKPVFQGSIAMNGMDPDVFLDFADKPHTTLRDAQLISAALTGSSDAFAELQGLYSRQLYSRILSRVLKKSLQIHSIIR